MGTLMSVVFPFWSAWNPRQKLDFFLDSFHPFSSFTAFSLLFHSATQLKCAEPERGRRRSEKRGNPPSHHFRKSLLATCSLEETKCCKDTPSASSVSTKAQGLSIPCMTESNYWDNYGYLDCPTVVFVIKSNIGRYESEPAENSGKLLNAYQPEAILF